jgi:putative ABC transport system ATP-binding protein
MIKGNGASFTSNQKVKTTAAVHNNNNNNPIALNVDGISKVFNSKVTKVIPLKDINIEVKRGEFVSIIGPSGSGKSTLLNIIGALDRPTHGKVYINRIDIFSLDDSQLATLRGNLIGFIFQTFNLISRTTVLKNVELPAIILGTDSNERARRALKLLDFLGLGDKANFKPSDLSGGQQQRVAIARALMNNPAIILADEPTGNLDTKTGNDVFGLLKMLSRKFRRTIVMVTHNPELAQATDRSIYIRDGFVEREVVNSI